VAIMKYRDWDPFKNFPKLIDFGSMLPSLWPSGWEEMRFPALDVEDKGNAFIVKAEIPGIRPDDIEIEIHNGQLMIRGEKREEKEEKDEERKYYYRERSFGSFSRTVSLGEEVDPDKVKAEYRDGILTVTLEKSEARKARKIKIKS
jgi:HSP20 family protein